MALRLHEVHPSLVHFPLALLPASLLLDIAGAVTGNKELMKAGRFLMPLTVASGGITALAGLIAQQSVRADGRAHDMLVTHRNLNVALLGMAGVLAGMRMRRERPGWGYLAMGLAGFAAMNYSAYLGGKMVYAEGVGSEANRGVSLSDSPEIRRGSILRTLALSLRHIAQGLLRAAREILHGELLPSLRHDASQAWKARKLALQSRADRGSEGGYDKVEREEAVRYRATGHSGAQGGYGSSYYDRPRPPGSHDGQ
jgi:uncharacterized membrane protein